MNITTSEIISAGLIVAVLVGVGIFYGYRQIQALRRLRTSMDLKGDERAYYRAQAIRRLLGSCCMLLVAGLMVGSYLLGQEKRAAESIQVDEAKGGSIAQAESRADRERFARQYSAFWILIFVLLLALVSLAFLDFWSNRRYWLRNYRKIQNDRREMIEHQVARLRGDRNGQ